MFTDKYEEVHVNSINNIMEKQNHSHIDLLKMDIEGAEIEVLEQILPEIKGNITFWLDAHFPGADAHMKTYESCLNIDADTNLPLEREIELISKRTSSYTDILIVDDLWIYEPPKIYMNQINNEPSATPIKCFFSLLKAGKLKASWKKAKGKLKAS